MKRLYLKKPALNLEMQGIDRFCKFYSSSTGSNINK